MDIIRFSFKFIERLNKKTENYAKHVMFSLQIAEFKVSEILLKVREKSGKVFIILDIIRFSFKSIERLNETTENYANHVMFSV